MTNNYPSFSLHSHPRHLNIGDVCQLGRRRLVLDPVDPLLCEIRGLLLSHLILGIVGRMRQWRMWERNLLRISPQLKVLVD